MDPQDPAPSYVINGHVIHIRYIVATPELVQDHNATHFYHIGPYDILDITVWNRPELTGVATTPMSGITNSISSSTAAGALVSENGMITYPYAGTFKVAGLSITEAQNLIAKRLEKYVHGPQVTVRVAAFRSEEVQVMGEIGGVKTIPLADKPVTLMDALNTVGGTNLMSANTKKIFVIRGTLQQLTIFAFNVQSPQNMMAAQIFVLKNNDIIYVPPMQFISWTRVFNQLLSVVGTGAAAAVTVRGLR